MQNFRSKGVAFKKMAFGEGQERLAHQFFEVEADGITVSGEPLVAKESRFISIGAKWEEHDKFAQQFCKTQQTARKYAIEFNTKLDTIKNLDPDTPRVSFLDCSIYYLNEPNGEERAIVVERRLQNKFQKWNNNNGVSLRVFFVLINHNTHTHIYIYIYIFNMLHCLFVYIL